MSEAQGSSNLPLAGQTAVVTGSSSGIGRQIALLFAQAGANVLVHARQSKEAAEEVAHQVQSIGRESHVVLRDLVEPENQNRVVIDAWKWKDIDLWINNAGADVLTGTPAEWSFEQKLVELWQVDVVATVRMSRDAGQRMKRRGKGIILNMGWDQAEVGMEGDSGELFATVKGAIMAFSRSLAKSLAPEVRVNCLAPGWIHTDWAGAANDYWNSRAEGESLMGRWGRPEDVAQLALFLVSPTASFINGQTIAVNGGFRTAPPLGDKP